MVLFLIVICCTNSNNMLRFSFTFFSILILQFSGWAQSVPNCRDINASVDAYGMIRFLPAEVITNIASGIDSVTVTITGDLDEIVHGPVRVSITDPVITDACRYIGKVLKVNVRNDYGACWSSLSVKKVSGPVILGRVFDVYCFDELVEGPLSPPVTIDVCGGVNRAVFVSDWGIRYTCEAGIQDTLKVILREWESIGKDGIRGVGYDTIVVFQLPMITEQNIYCVDKDTVYCSDLSAFTGPVISIPASPLDPSTCIEVPLIEVSDTNHDGILEFTSAIFGTICNFSTHIESRIFEVDCSKQYKITLDIKQSCFGMSQSGCIVPVPAGTLPNIAENVAPGYWRCEFWLVDLDTVPPDLHCKYPILFSGEFKPGKWYESISGEGYVDTTWTPYKISLTNLNGNTNYCVEVEKDTVLAFAWEFRSQDPDAMYNPFGYVLNGTFYQLSTGIPGVSSGPVYQNGYKIVELRAGDLFCFSQQSSGGQNGATTTIKALPIVTTSDHDCLAHSYIPPVVVTDDWSGVKQVKASIPGIGTYVMTYNSASQCYESHERAPLPHRADPYIIVYEAQDSCHNTAVDTCYILVKDRVKPTAVVDKGITVSLSEKKVWVDAGNFDEGSFDNCEVNLLLVRRADWYESCINLCDSLDPICITEHGDTLWLPELETNKDVDPVEAHYGNNLKWWKEDLQPCTNIIYNSWIYDLIKRSTYTCREHPYHFDEHHVKELIKECLPSIMDYFIPVALHPDPYREGEEIPSQEDFRVDNRLLQTYDQIGGGWSDAVPFDCSDACGAVTVEILVMDYWCNWSKAWTQVWVEDKIPVQIVEDVEDIEITCKTYKTARYDLEGHNDPLSIASIIDLAKEKDAVALGALDAIFGGYQKVWKGPYGNYLDENGMEVELQIPFIDSSCYCVIDEIVKKRYYDEHLGYYWKTDTIWDCGYEAQLDTFSQGLVLANCNNFIGCDQEVWCEIDHCGEGYIYRKFKVWQGCPASFYTDEGVPESLKTSHLPDTITRTQRIRIYNECGLEKHMFSVPEDLELVSCGIEYDANGSGKVGGDLHPDKTGWLQYRFDDDCRLVGIDYEDKVFKIVGGEQACYKIQRTWYFMDWCAGQPVDVLWYHNPQFDYDSCIQHIFLIDTVAPVCTIGGPVQDGETIESGDCYYDFEAEVIMSDSCGITSYRWELYEVSNPDQIDLIDGFQSPKLKSPETDFGVSIPDLAAGKYRLKVVVTDECGNQGECFYHFNVVSIKKPTPVCLTSLTTRLNPMDLDQDGLIDTAMVTLWAREYDQSSRIACNDTSLEFRLELKDGIDDETWEEDTDSLQLGCGDTGTRILRMWVISWPSGTADYCDILAVIVGNTGCSEPVVDTVKSVTETIHEVQQINPNIQTRKPDNFLNHQDVRIPLRLGGSEGDEDSGFALDQNYPNPFTSVTTIGFSLPRTMEATISVFNINGQLVKRIGGEFPAGDNQVDLQRDLFPVNGIYYYQLQTAGFQDIKRMILLQ